MTIETTPVRPYVFFLDEKNFEICDSADSALQLADNEPGPSSVGPLQYVPRYDNGSGYMEWATVPTLYFQDAEAEAKRLSAYDSDVLKVYRDERNQKWIELGTV